MDYWLLTVIIFSPLVGAILLWLPPHGDDRSIRRSALFYTLVTLGLTIFALVRFYALAPQHANESPEYLLSHTIPWLFNDAHEATSVDDAAAMDAIDISYRVGVDGISIWLLVLTSFLMPLAVWSSFTAIKERMREYYSLLLLLQDIIQCLQLAAIIPA